MAKEKVLVTGAGGFLGLSLTRMLIGNGVAVRSLNRNAYPSLRQLGVEEVLGDLQDYKTVNNAVKGVDAVFHVASKTGVWGSYQSYAGVNITGTENIIKACNQNNIKHLIYTSTPSVVFNRTDICNGNESLPYPSKFLCHYAETKAKAEELILNATDNNMSTTALRPHLIWGPEDTNLIPRLINKGRSGKLKKVGNGSNLVDIIYVDNAAQAHIQAWQELKDEKKCAGKAYFISQDKPVNLWNWIDDLFKATSTPAIKSKISFKSAYNIGAVIESIYHLIGIKSEPPMTRFIAEQLSKSHYFDISAAKQDFNYKPEVSTKEGLSRTITWIKAKL